MSFKFKLDNSWADVKLYKRCSVTLKPGLTVLVGCNGSGKSVFLRQLKERLEKDKITYVDYDNLKDGGSTSIGAAVFQNDITFAATAILSSEGENINMNLSRFAARIGQAVRSNRGAEKIFILLDAIDSGLSIDNIVNFKIFLYNTVFPDINDTELYVVAAANSYELASEEDCYDVAEGKHIKFHDYAAYKQFILDSSDKKAKRDNIQR